MLSICLLTVPQPCTVRDFINYLIHVERSAENLQFYLWYKDYSERFAILPYSDLVLSPEWTEKQATTKKHNSARTSKKPPNIIVDSVIKEVDFTPPTPLSPNPFNTPPPSSCGDEKSISSSTAVASDVGHTSTTYSKAVVRELAAEALDHAEKLQPCASQIMIYGRRIDHS